MHLNGSCKKERWLKERNAHSSKKRLNDVSYCKRSAKERIAKVYLTITLQLKRSAEGAYSERSAEQRERLKEHDIKERKVKGAHCKKSACAF